MTKTSHTRQLPPRPIAGCPGGMVMNAGGGCDPAPQQKADSNPPKPPSYP